MGQSADQLREMIAQDRRDAAQKINEIEAQVEDAAHRVEDTAEQVAEHLDVRRQIEERPLLALGAALAGGFLLGSIIGGGNQQPQPQPATRSHKPHRQPAKNQPGFVSGTLERWAQESGFDSTVSNMAAAFVATMTDKVERAVDESLPGFANNFRQAQRAGGGFAARTKAALREPPPAPVAPPAPTRTRTPSPAPGSSEVHD